MERTRGVRTKQKPSLFVERVSLSRFSLSSSPSPFFHPLFLHPLFSSFKLYYVFAFHFCRSWLLYASLALMISLGWSAQGNSEPRIVYQFGLLISGFPTQLVIFLRQFLAHMPLPTSICISLHFRFFYPFLPSTSIYTVPISSPRANACTVTLFDSTSPSV